MSSREVLHVLQGVRRLPESGPASAKVRSLQRVHDMRYPAVVGREGIEDELLRQAQPARLRSLNARMAARTNQDAAPWRCPS